MPRKRATTHSMAGRPPKDPLERVGWPVRALVTQPVIQALMKDMENTGLRATRAGQVSSDIVRLAIYERLKRVGLMTEELEQDPSWQPLREKGLI